MITFDLDLLPSGYLHFFPNTADAAVGKAAASIGKSFARGVGMGFLPWRLGNGDTDIAPSLY